MWTRVVQHYLFRKSYLPLSPVDGDGANSARRLEETVGVMALGCRLAAIRAHLIQDMSLLRFELTPANPPK